MPVNRSLADLNVPVGRSPTGSRRVYSRPRVARLDLPLSSGEWSLFHGLVESVPRNRGLHEAGHQTPQESVRR